MRLPKFTALPVLEEQEMLGLCLITVKVVVDTTFFSPGQLAHGEGSSGLMPDEPQANTSLKQDKLPSTVIIIRKNRVMIIDNIRLFQTIAEQGSLVAAARETGLSATRVSERLAALEAHYGVVLFNRTTRSLSLTEEGRTLLEGARTVLAEIEDLDARIRYGANTLSGPIRLSTPVDLGRTVVSSVIDQFTIDHPAISVELSLSDGYVDIVGQGFDLAIRYGTVTDSSLRVRSLGSIRRIVCAAPAYLDRHGTPRTPDDLTQHACLVMRFGVTLDNVWRFGSGASAREVTVRGNKIVNDGYLVRQWALAGQGIILKSELDVAQDLADGRLVALLEEYAAPAYPLQIMFPPGRAQPRRVGALAEALNIGIGKSCQTRSVPMDDRCRLATAVEIVGGPQS